MTIPSMLHVKASLYLENDETTAASTRRFSVAPSSFADLCKVVREYFQLETGILRLQYIDDELDRVELSNQAEFEEAIGLLCSDPSAPALRLLLFTHAKKSPWKTENASREARLARRSERIERNAETVITDDAPSAEVARDATTSAVATVTTEDAPVVPRSWPRLTKDERQQMRRLRHEARTAHKSETLAERIAIRATNSQLNGPFRRVLEGKNMPFPKHKKNSPRVPFSAMYVDPGINGEHKVVVSPGEKFTKSWRVKNDGPLPWPDTVRVRPVGRHIDQSSYSVAVSAAAPNELILLLVTMEAPSVPGRYVSYWRLFADDTPKSRFGMKLWADVLVKDTEQAKQTMLVATVPSDGEEELPRSNEGAAAPSLLEATTKPCRHAVQLAQLKRLGFSDDEYLLSLLEKFSGQMNLVLDQLLGA